MVGLAWLLACNGGDADVNRRVLVRLAQEPTPAEPSAAADGGAQRHEDSLREQFTVTTHRRVVRLKGVVHSAAERDRLERAAREVDGVANVENQLVVVAPVELTSSRSAYEISSMNNPADAVLHDQIRRRLDAQELDDIAVEVKDGVVTFRGSVPPKVHDAAIQIAVDAHADVDDRMTIIEP